MREGNRSRLGSTVPKSLALTPNQVAKPMDPHVNIHIDTRGGAYIAGGVHTQGNFIGRDDIQSHPLVDGPILEKSY